MKNSDEKLRPVRISVLAILNKHIMKYLYLLLLIVTSHCFAQKKQSKEQILTERNFYIITALKQNKVLIKVMPTIAGEIVTPQNCIFKTEEINKLAGALNVVYYQNQKEIDQLLNENIRPSNAYILYHNLSNKEFWQKCWQAYYRGINYIINTYALGKKARYPAVDSASFQTGAPEYQQKIKEITNNQQQTLNTPFYQIPLYIALELLKLNKRDEASRFEPIDQNENKKAIRQVKKTDFNQYKYTAILIPGEGPEDNAPLSEGGKKRCDLAAEAYKNKKAPFLILSGGNVHPFQTPYNEAIEMKKYLMEKYSIPENAIIIDPHARHTTTNFRNAGRYLINYGFPLDKPALCLSDREQTDYIADPRFGERNQKELGYLPYKGLKRISANEIEFYPVKESLFRDPIDPLDP